MKNPIVFIILLLAHVSSGQNYKCLQYGTKQYFINQNGYLRAMHLDSVRSVGSETIYYPFHTPRGTYDPTSYIPLVLDLNGGSWLGKKVVELADGTFIFDSYWNDSVIIRSQANVGDSWTFYQDSSSLYYTAIVIATDTMTVLSALDSVKKIMINARNITGIVASDPLDSMVLILSKDHGFVRILDLYTFPYHKPDSAYRLGLDFFLDRSTCTPSNINNNSGLPVTPRNGVTLFDLVNFINPSATQLTDWNVGDVLHSTHSYGPLPWGTSTISESILDTVIAKVVSGYTTTYTLAGGYATCTYTTAAPPCVYPHSAGTSILSDIYYPIADTGFIPELYFNQGNYIFYYPADSTYCRHSPAYTKVIADYNIGLGYTIEEMHCKLGIGMVNYYYFVGEPFFEKANLAYYDINGVSCGTYPIDTARHTESVKSTGNNVTINLYPNPTNDILTITSSENILNIYVIDLIGRVVNSTTTYGKRVEINVGHLPEGSYIVRINDTNYRKFIKN